jgi:hypothetical protein
MDLGFFRPVYDGGTGYASVYIDTSATETAGREMPLRWRSARERLAERGADAATLDAIGAAVAERGPGPYCFTVIARAGAVLLTWTLPLGSGYEISEFAPLPRVMPLLAGIPRSADAESRARAEEFGLRMNGQPGLSRRAVQGLDATLAALRAGLVSDLLLADAPAPADAQGSAAKAWIGPKPADAAIAKEQLTERGITPLGADRADEVLVRAAAGTGASLFFLPPDAGRPRDGVGALLRAPMAAAVFDGRASG